MTKQYNARIKRKRRHAKVKRQRERVQETISKQNK